jgi:predicted metal-dependent hydrolase
MLHIGENCVDGVTVRVVRKRVRRINIRVSPVGEIMVSLPAWGATLAEAWNFLMSKWAWLIEARREILARRAAMKPPLSKDEVDALRELLVELNRKWMQRTQERPFSIRLRRMKSLWGSCHWLKRRITYNTELARYPKDVVEYVVVHEITHFAEHDHGAGFKALMDNRLPEWRLLRGKLRKI